MQFSVQFLNSISCQSSGRTPAQMADPRLNKAQVAKDLAYCRRMKELKEQKKRRRLLKPSFSQWLRRVKMHCRLTMTQPCSMMMSQSARMVQWRTYSRWRPSSKKRRKKRGARAKLLSARCAGSIVILRGSQSKECAVFASLPPQMATTPVVPRARARVAAPSRLPIQEARTRVAQPASRQRLIRQSGQQFGCEKAMSGPMSWLRVVARAYVLAAVEWVSG